MLLKEEMRETCEFLKHRLTSRFGGMRGEDGNDLCVIGESSHSRADRTVPAKRGNGHRDRGVYPFRTFGLFLRTLSDLVDLVCSICEKKVEMKRPDDFVCTVDRQRIDERVHASQQGRGWRLPERSRHPSDALDILVQIRSFLLPQDNAEDPSESLDITAKVRVDRAK